MVLVIVSIVVGLVVAALAFLTFFSARLTIAPGRHPLWGTPKDYGLPFETVRFPSQDGLELPGWFIPVEGATGRTPTIIMVHGWPWNRMGTKSNNRLNDFPGGLPVDLMPVMVALHRAGYHVLTFDMRNFGEGPAAPPVTYGWLEKRDLLGALAYAAARPDVDPDRLGVFGFSMGGNTLVFALPYTDRIRAGIAVQANTSPRFSERFGKDRMGPLRFIVPPIVEFFYRLSGGLATKHIQPVYAAAAGRKTPVLYVQGTGDKWGSVEDVQQMVDATPGAVTPLYPETPNRFAGYHWVVEHPEVAIAFFREHLGPGATAA